MPKGLETVLQVALALVGAYLAAFWFCLVVWTFRDIQKRTRDVLVQILATLLVLLFNIPGLILYTILRPPETLAEAYARSLEEEALLSDLAERQACPECRYRAQPDFRVCPNCGTRLRYPCPHCERLLNLTWRVCPYCARPAAPPTEPPPARAVAPRASGG